MSQDALGGQVCIAVPAFDEELLPLPCLVLLRLHVEFAFHVSSRRPIRLWLMLSLLLEDNTRDKVNESILGCDSARGESLLSQEWLGHIVAVCRDRSLLLLCFLCLRRR